MDRQKLDEIIRLVDGAVKPLGFECLEAEWVGDRRILRVFVDEPGGINLDGCVAASRIVNMLSELDALINGKYTLEVSSPGVERPLRNKSHFEKHIGQTAKVRLEATSLNKCQGTGKIIAVSEDSNVTLETGEGVWSFPLDKVQKATLIYDWKTKSSNKF